ncbi:MAG: HAD-IC family P-type ATPase, partial [Coriobacteriia bacterium]|nr:HAD-IC family P-type ATPase [Coriobacteriia bacterium]
MSKPVPAPAELPEAYRVDAPHTADVAAVLAHLASTASGLTEAESARRLVEAGANTLPEGEVRTIPQMVADQFKDFLILLLIGAAIVSGVLGELADTIAIVVIVALNAIIGVVQEYRAERAMEALREMAAETATVRRDGRTSEIHAADLAPGDIVLLDAGRVVPADLRLIESAGLRVAEAALTGESLPVEKYTEPIDAVDAPIGDRTSMAYRGTQVVHGRGVGVVTGTGL